MSSKETNQKTLRYCAYDSVKKDFLSASVLILVLIPVMCVVAEQGPLGKRVLPTTMLVIFFWGFFIIFFAVQKRRFETILVSEEQITICLPGKASVEIPWSESVSVGSFSGAGKMKLSYQGRHWYELVLSSETLSPLYQVDSTIRFSSDEYAETGSWRVSLGRGNQKWCQKQIELIEGMKQKALLNKFGQQE